MSFLDETMEVVESAKEALNDILPILEKTAPILVEALANNITGGSVILALCRAFNLIPQSNQMPTLINTIKNDPAPEPKIMCARDDYLCTIHDLLMQVGELDLNIKISNKENEK